MSMKGDAMRADDGDDGFDYGKEPQPEAREEDMHLALAASFARLRELAPEIADSDEKIYRYMKHIEAENAELRARLASSQGQGDDPWQALVDLYGLVTDYATIPDEEYHKIANAADLIQSNVGPLRKAHPQPEAREEDMAALQWREAYLRQCSDSAFLTQKIKDLEAEREHWCEPLRAEIAALSRLAAKEGRVDHIPAAGEMVKLLTRAHNALTGQGHADYATAEHKLGCPLCSATELVGQVIWYMTQPSANCDCDCVKRAHATPEKPEEGKR